MDIPDIGIIILAAGDSSRMGQSKQLLTIEDESLLSKSVKATLHSGAKHIVVVLGAYEAAHKKVISDLPIHIVINSEWKRGMGSSIKTGLKSILKLDSALSAVIILVCDQPYLSVDHIKNLIAKQNETQLPIAASGYANTAGVPVLFDRSMFDSLLELKDEQGAKKIIEQDDSRVAIVDFPKGSIDLDTMEDYDRFKKQAGLK